MMTRITKTAIFFFPILLWCNPALILNCWAFSSTADSSKKGLSSWTSSRLPQHTQRMSGKWAASWTTSKSTPTTLLSSQQEQEPGIDATTTLLKQQRDVAKDTLDQIESLRKSIEAETAVDEDLSAMSSSYAEAVSKLEAQVSALNSTLIPPRGLSIEEYRSSIRLFVRLPYSVRWALCDALEFDQDAASNVNEIPAIVSKLYQERVRLTPQRLEDSYKAVQTQMERSSMMGKFTMTTSSPSTTSAEASSTPSKDANQGFMSGIMNGMNEAKTDEEFRKDAYVENLFGKVTRKKDKPVTKDDLDTVLKVLSSSNKNFAVTGSEEIPGGYVIRGTNAKESGSALLADIDKRLPSDFPCQLSYMPDITSTAQGDVIETAEPVLVLLNKDFTRSTAGWLTTFCTASALFTALLFSIGVYGSNDIVTSKITEITTTLESGGTLTSANGLDWFNGRVLEVFVPLFALQVLHETGHQLVAWTRNFKTATPVLLPFYSALPFLNCKTDITTSPENRAALFDFAFLGPFLGIVGSMATLLYGLQLTATADASVAQYLPSLPVSVLRSSTLGGTIVDYFFGGDGFITLQDPSTAVPLHPLAIAGFACLMMNAIELLPLGSTDGGRMSQTIFGRSGQSVIGAVFWVTLLISSFFVDNVDILIGGWLVYNFVQNDLEIPCRDEVEQVDFFRVLAAMGLWSVAVLTLVPM